MKEIKLAIIGVGARGDMLLTDAILPQKRCAVTAVCDIYRDRAEKSANDVKETDGNMPAIYTDYREAIDDVNVNTVVISAAWEAHVEIAVYAMRAGKTVALEVGGAYCVEDCWTLVNTYEETKTPFMFLENCCYGRREMMVLNMVQKGVFGEIVHCAGGYQHDLREEVSFGIEKRHYRLRNYLTRNCENYPTHELGPIAKVLGINHGNRMLSLSSFASKSCGLHEYIMKNKSDDELLKNAHFNQGDIITTVISCANGETITITLDTTLPRFYSRNFTVRGTKGMYEEATDSVFMDTEECRKHDFDWRKECGGNADKYTKEYEHPVWKKFIEDGIQGSHDGMDWLEFKAFFDCIEKDEPMPIDVYDAASWMVITALSEMSIAQGGAPVSIPDFTRGKWAYETKYLKK